MDQWVELLTRPSLEYKVPNIDWIIEFFSGKEEVYGKPDPGMKSWAQTLGAPKDIIK